ncbi:MAG: AmmeMemoRadiSam system protein A [Candidatus Theseobacter exili]|nr:AmmeMemoRadiSam system protein A [Candidatus Theseobacter exili]
METLKESDKILLLRLARETIVEFLSNGTVSNVSADQFDEALNANRACFVTLQKRGSGLRGCIGTFDTGSPLYENVISRAIAAATQDYRFNRVDISEMKDIKIEISVLTPPEPLIVSSADELLDKIKPDIDGVILKTRFGGRQSTFLPQVWDQIPSKEQFFSHLCMKQGAPDNAWKDDFKHVEIFTYQAIKFEENKYGGDMKE